MISTPKKRSYRSFLGSCNAFRNKIWAQRKKVPLPCCCLFQHRSSSGSGNNNGTKDQGHFLKNCGNCCCCCYRCCCCCCNCSTYIQSPWRSPRCSPPAGAGRSGSCPSCRRSWTLSCRTGGGSSCSAPLCATATVFCFLLLLRPRLRRCCCNSLHVIQPWGIGKREARNILLPLMCVPYSSSS